MPYWYHAGNRTGIGNYRNAGCRRFGLELAQMEALYFTLVAIVLYLVSDRVLDRIEIAAGRRFEHRSLVFFAILLTLALVTFSLIRWYTGNS